METEIIYTIVRESVSLGILVIFGIGVYRLANKLIDLIDSHQTEIEEILKEILNIMREKK